MSRKNESDLTLLYFPSSYYSQRAACVLVEKKLPFRRKIINLAAREVYSPSFLKINPNGQVPVLQDGSLYIPDSNKMFDYLEEKYVERPLQPDLKTELGERVQHFRDLYDTVQIEILTYGSAVHPDLLSAVRLPWIAASKMRGAIENDTTLKAVEKLDSKCKDPQLKEIYAKKKIWAKDFSANVLNKSRVIAARDQVKEVLDETEQQLRNIAQRFPDEESWLCGTEFTVADVWLMILLGRLEFTGFSASLFENGLLPYVEAYNKRVKKRESYKDVMSKMSLSVMISVGLGSKLKFIGVGSLLLAGVGVGYYLYTKYK